MKEYKGFVDKINFPIIRGWVFDINSPLKKTKVIITINNNRKITVQTGLFRIKTKLKESHPTGNCGFECIIPKEYLNSGNNIIKISIEDEFHKIPNSEFNIYFNEGDESTTPKFFFMHIAKTGGTTVNEIMSGQFSEGKCINHIESQPWPKMQLFWNYDYVSGHIPYQLFNKYYSLENVIVTTILRNPVEQVTSHLRWLKFIGSDPSSEFFKRHTPAIQKISQKIRIVDFSQPKSLYKYVKSFAKSEQMLFDNLQTRYFIRDPFKNKINSFDVDDALSIIPKFSVIGFNNQLEFFFSELNNLGLDIKPRSEIKLNVNHNKFGLDHKDPEIQEVLYPLYNYDLELYNKLNNTNTNS